VQAHSSKSPVGLGVTVPLIQNAVPFSFRSSSALHSSPGFSFLTPLPFPFGMSPFRPPPPPFSFSCFCCDSHRRYFSPIQLLIPPPKKTRPSPLFGTLALFRTGLFSFGFFCRSKPFLPVLSGPPVLFELPLRGALPLTKGRAFLQFQFFFYGTTKSPFAVFFLSKSAMSVTFSDARTRCLNSLCVVPPPMVAQNISEWAPL